MIPLRSRSDSLTFTAGWSAVGSDSNFSRCPNGNDAVWDRASGEIPTLQVEAEVSNRKWMLEIDVIDGQEFEQLLTYQDKLQAGRNRLAIEQVRYAAHVVVFELIQRV